MDVIQKFVEAVHGRLGVVELHIAVAFFKFGGKDGGVVQVRLFLLRGLDSINKLADGLSGISLHKLVLELLPEHVALFSVQVRLQGDTAQ